MTSTQVGTFVLIFGAMMGGGILSALVATFKRRNGLLWFALGAVIPLFSLAIIAMLPICEPDRG